MSLLNSNFEFFIEKLLSGFTKFEKGDLSELNKYFILMDIALCARNIGGFDFGGYENLDYQSDAAINLRRHNVNVIIDNPLRFFEMLEDHYNMRRVYSGDFDADIVRLKMVSIYGEESVRDYEATCGGLLSNNDASSLNLSIFSRVAFGDYGR